MDINNLTPEQVALILGSGEDDPAYSEAAKKDKIAEAMMARANTGPGRMVGRVFVGTSPLEAAAGAMSGHFGNKMSGEADAMRQGAHSRSVESRKAYGQAMIEALRKRAGGQTPPVSPASPPTVQQSQPEEQFMGIGGY